MVARLGGDGPDPQTDRERVVTARLRTIVARAGELFRRRRLDRELAEELEQHLELLTGDFIKRGLPPAEARRAARRELGGVAHVSAAVGDVRGFRWLDSLALACRQAVRRLLSTPGFTAATLIILALGIGVSTGIFTVVYAVLLQPLPYPDAGRLIGMVERNRTAQTGGAVAPANLADYQRRSRSISGFAAYSRIGGNVSGDAEPERLAGEEIDRAYFEVLKIAPAVGRGFEEIDFDLGGAPVVVISDAVWKRRFGSGAGVLTRALTLDGVPHRIVGVMPPGFRGVSDLGGVGDAAYWVPFRLEQEMRDRRTEFIARAIGRLAPGVTLAEARAEIAVLSEALSEAHAELRGMHAVIAPLGEDQFAAVRPMLTSLVAAVALVLLIACVNIANLLVVRAAARQREIAIRVAMGASRARVAGELLVESVLLGVAAAGLAFVLGAWTTQLLISLAPASIPRIGEASFDLRSFAVTAALGFAIGLTFGLLPAFQVSRAQPTDVLKATDRRAGGGWLAGSRRLLLAVEITLSIVLLVGAGLMIRSLMALNRVDLGFEPAGVLNATIPLAESKYSSPAARHAFFERVAERAAAIPSVTSVAFANGFPLRGGWTSGFMLEPAGAEPPVKTSAGFQAVSPGFFATLGIDLIRGRLLQPEDREHTQPVAVVSASFSRALLSGADPIGRRLRRGPQAPAIQIVGVVTDIRRGGRTTEVEPQVYLAAAQTQLYPTRLAELAVRVNGDSSAVAATLRDAVLSVDPAQPTINVRTLDETLSLRQAERHFQTMLFTLFAGLALVLAVTGVYSLAAYVITQRTSEIGVRIALGANPARILGWVVGQSLSPIAAGTVVGILLAAFFSERVSSLLFNTSPMDLTTYLLASATLIASALAAVALAGRSATQVDPVSVLK